jgi:membrane associated rhomboid family serine protease
VLSFLLLAILLFLGFRVTSAEDRQRIMQRALAFIRQGKEAATRGEPEGDAFRDALRARMPRANATLALVSMIAAATLLTGSETLTNIGLRTTNGEWWRLLTSAFVQAGFLQFLINLAVLAQVGFVVERLLGSVALAATFAIGAIFAGIVHLSVDPLAAGAGASGALFALYGVLTASVVWSLLRPSGVTMPLATRKTYILTGSIFVLYSLADGSIAAAAELTSFLAGLCCGAVLGKNVNEEQVEPRRVGMVAGACAVVALLMALPLRGLMDVRPEIQKVVALEDRTAGAYSAAVDKFRKGRMTADALAQMIERTIVPELEAADGRLKTYTKIPAEHQPLVADAEAYLRLRCASWRLRADAVRKSNAVPRRDPSSSDAMWRMSAEARHRANAIALGNAEGAERTSLEAFQKIAPH